MSRLRSLALAGDLGQQQIGALRPRLERAGPRRQGQAGLVIIHPKQSRNPSVGIRRHLEFYIFKGFFTPLPCQVDKLGVRAYGYNFASKFLELFIPLCQSGKLGCSNKGEVGGIKEKNRPFAIFFKLI